MLYVSLPLFFSDFTYIVKFLRGLDRKIKIDVIGTKEFFTEQFSTQALFM